MASPDDNPHADVTQGILAAAFEVHNALGPGFLESVYEEALTIELSRRELPFRRQVQAPVYYREKEVGTHVLDLIVSDKVIVELKAVKELVDVHKAIVRSYLAATRLPVALLLNFSRPRLEYKRIVLTQGTP